MIEENPDFIRYFNEWAVRDGSGENQKSSVVEWEIFEILGLEPGPISFPILDDMSRMIGNTEDIAKATPWARLAIKWDGCSHFYLFDKDEAFHICGIKIWQKWNVLIEDLYARSAKKMIGLGNKSIDKSIFLPDSQPEWQGFIYSHPQGECEH